MKIEMHDDSLWGLLGPCRGAVDMEGQIFPTVQHAVYMGLLSEERHRRLISHIEDPLELKNAFECFFDMELRERMASAVCKAYDKIFQTIHWKKPKGTLFVYKPSSRMRATRHMFYWGVDPHGHGWNICGRGLSPRPQVDVHVCFMIYLVASALYDQLFVGDRLSRFFGRTVSEMIADLGLEQESENNESFRTFAGGWQRGETRHNEIILEELAYPGSLVHLIRRRFAPMVNHELRRRRALLLREAAQELFYRWNPGVKAPFLEKLPVKLRDNLEFLFLKHKLPMRAPLLEEARRLSLLLWTEAEIRQAVDFFPLNRKSMEVIVFDELSHPVLSPLSPSRAFFVGERTLRHMMEFLYVELLTPLIGAEDAFLRTTGIRDWKSKDPDELLLSACREAFCSRLDAATRSKFRDGWCRWALLTTGNRHLHCHIPCDPLLGMTQGPFLEKARAEIAQSLEIQELMGLVVGGTAATPFQYCALEARRRGLKNWMGMFHLQKPSLEKKFYRIFYPENNPFVEPDARSIVDRMTNEIHGPLLLYLKKRRRAEALARILYDVCLPLAVFHHNIPWEATALEERVSDPFFCHVLSHAGRVCNQESLS